MFLLLAIPAPAADHPANPYESASSPTLHNRIDELVFSQLKRLNLESAALSSDAVFLRRTYLDTVGTLPTVREAQQFLLSRDPKKRSHLIDSLLQRPEFADYWAMKWSDLLRIKAEFPINLWPNAAQAYYRWIQTVIRTNMPYDAFARELLTASGSNFRVPPVNFYRALQSREPEAIAQVVALTFMGSRADKWPKARLEGMAAFFDKIEYKSTSEWKEEIVIFDPLKTNAHNYAKAVFPDGELAKLSNEQDPREVFASWLIDPANPAFTRPIVNRIWAWLLGRGIIHEPDDIRPDNPPSNPKLLAFLEHELASSGFDLKHIYRLILNSSTYQLASVPAAVDARTRENFAAYPVRRLDAEVLIDAICQITGTNEKYTSQIPEPFTYIPENKRSIALPDGSISSPFLDLFGRPPRDTGLESERNNRCSAAQRVHLLNSSHIQKKIEQSGALQYFLKSKDNSPEAISGLYLLVLSRFPAAEELKIATGYLDARKSSRREAAIDLVWSLINNPEFLCRH